MGQEPVTIDYEKHKVHFYRVFERFFGAKGRKLDENILRGYWKALGNYDINHLSKALDNLASEEDQFMPDSGKIIAEIKRIRGYESTSRATSAIPTWCEICNMTGMVLVEKMHDGRAYNTVYACRCENGGRHQFLKLVPEDFVAPVEAPLDKLPMVTMETLAGMDPGHVWDGGVDVAKLCGACRRPYVVRHQRRVCAQELQDTHLKTQRPPQCDLCHVEEGRRIGMWK